jgi:hypothetical protein
LVLPQITLLDISSWLFPRSGIKLRIWGLQVQVLSGAPLPLAASVVGIYYFPLFHATFDEDGSSWLSAG